MEKPPAVASVAATEAEEEEEEILDAFTCCICLDLLYKPVVLACGHMACFWCVHHSMSFRDQSNCPICRNPYRHFPAICVTLHFLLLKLYPLASKRREGQVLEDEKGKRIFSPQYGSNLGTIDAKRQYDRPKDLAHSSSSAADSNIGSGGNDESPTSVVQPRASSTGNDESLSIDDVRCVACGELLFLPVVLNCGHAFCDYCIVRPANGAIKCQVCQSFHPRGTLKVCLEFDRFLKDGFPEEYKSRRETAQPAQVMTESPTAGLGESSKEGMAPLPTEEQSDLTNIHRGVGCDACGMCPIMGERYRCIDCLEAIGYDLCGECYNSRSKLPGRFNQQHTEEHKFEHIGLLRRVMMDAHMRRLLRVNDDIQYNAAGNISIHFSDDDEEGEEEDEVEGNENES